MGNTLRSYSPPFLSFFLFLSIVLIGHFLSYYHLLVLESDFASLNFLANKYTFLLNFLKLIADKINLNIINSFFIFKVVCLSLIAFITPTFFKNIGVSYYISLLAFSLFIYDFIYYIPIYLMALAIIFLLFIFYKLHNNSTLRNIFLALILISLIFLFLQNKEIAKMDIFHNLKINKDIYIPSITQIQEKIKLYQVFIFTSIFIVSILRVYFKSSYIFLILLPSIIFSLYSIFSYIPNKKNDINHKALSINNSIIFSLNSDKQKLQYYFKNNFFIANDYIFSDIISSDRGRSIYKMNFFSSYYQKNNTAKNLFTKGIKSSLKNKDMYLYINRYSLPNLKALFSIASFDVFKNKAKEVFLEVGNIVYTLDENKYYKKSMSKKLYISNKFKFDLSKGEIHINNQVVKINNAFLVDKKVKKIDYNNKSKSPLISIVVKNKYLIICHKDYLKSFFIQAILFKNYPSKNISKVYDENDDVILKIKSDESGQILGVSIIVNGATEFMHELLIAVKSNLIILEFQKMIFAHSKVVSL